MIGIIIFLFITAVLTLIFLGVRSAVQKVMTPKNVELGTSLSEFKESSEIVLSVKAAGSSWMNNNDARLYEIMCVEEPLKYTGDPRIEGIIKGYFNTLNGRVVDTYGCNTPSEFILGKPNPHYGIYLTNQIKALRENGREVIAARLSRELKRIKNIEEGKVLRAQFISHMIDMGVDPIIAVQGTTDDKLDSYNEDNWNTYIKKVKAYIREAGELVTVEFVMSFDDKDIVLDPFCFRRFVTYYKYEVPLLIIRQILTGSVSDEQALRIIYLVQDSGYNWDEATKEVLDKDFINIQSNILRKQYGFSN